MLIFFRKLRKNLLSENKIGRYLAYALGEIILVVIGILIALQINNWRQQSLDRAKECIYLTDVILDLNSQLEVIQAQIDFESEVIRDSEFILESYYLNKSFDVNLEFSKRINTLNNRKTFSKSNSTFQELLSTGNLNIISDYNLKTLVLNYFQSLELEESIISKNNAYIDNHFAPLILGLSTHLNPNLQIEMFQDIIAKGLMKPEIVTSTANNEHFYKTIEKYINEPLKSLNFLNQVQYRYRISGVHLSAMLELRDRTSSLIKEVKLRVKDCDP